MSLLLLLLVSPLMLGTPITLGTKRICRPYQLFMNSDGDSPEKRQNIPSGPERNRGKVSHCTIPTHTNKKPGIGQNNEKKAKRKKTTVGEALILQGLAADKNEVKRLLMRGAVVAAGDQGSSKDGWKVKNCSLLGLVFSFLAHHTYIHTYVHTIWPNSPSPLSLLPLSATLTLYIYIYIYI